MRRRAVVLAGLSALAGCQTVFDDREPGASADRETSADGETGTEAATTTGESNPWGTPSLAVSVVDSAGPWRDVTDLVSDALSYWNEDGAEYARYEVDLELQPDAADPDVIVRYVEDVGVCGSPNSDGGAGFAPRISGENPPDPPEYVCVRAGFTESATRHILTHEFGHLLDVGHGEPPRDLMGTDHDYLPVPRPSPAVLSATLPQNDLAVSVDRSNIFARRDYVARTQLEEVFAYYERGASNSFDRPVSTTAVDDPDAADVVVTFPRESPCDRNREGSCATVETRPDGQPRLEVAITTTHEDTFGWHAGFWLAVALGVDRHRDLPAPFRDATFDERRGGWWTDDP